MSNTAGAINRGPDADLRPIPAATLALTPLADRIHNLHTRLLRAHNLLRYGSESPPTPAAALAQPPELDYDPGLAGTLNRTRDQIVSALNDLEETIDSLNALV